MAKTKTVEQLAKEIYKEMLADGEEVTEAEALEMARMELGAKDIKNYVQSDVTKKPKKPKERKVDEEKGYLLGEVRKLLNSLGATDSKQKTETEINFNFNNTSYTIKLTKHRPKK